MGRKIYKLETIEEVLSLHDKGVNDTQISYETRIAYNTIRKWIKERKYWIARAKLEEKYRL